MSATYTYSEELYSDLHKDALGFRPGESGWAWWKNASDDERQAAWDNLLVRLDESIREEEENQNNAKAEFEALVTTIINSGAKTRDKAIEWIIAPLDTNGGDMDYVCYQMGLPYGYLNDYKPN